MATRWVVVDDNSTDINFIGDSWFADVGSRDSAGNFGPPFLSTLHGTNTSASLAFNFTGSRVRVMGSNQIRNDSGVIDPQWSCYVDGINIDTGSPFQYAENNWQFCSAYNLTDGLHTITVNATVARSQTFWFDRIEYAPSTSVSLANRTIMLTSVDSAIQYGSGWSSYANIGNWTQTQGSVFALNFYGTSLSWYGHIPTEWNGNSTTAKWAIDDKAAQVFILKGHGTGAVTMYNQKFFETPVYPLGPHTLTVTYNGDTQKTPLVLGYLAIQNNTVTNSTTGSVSSPTQTTSSETPAIVGGVIGGVAFLLVVILLVLYRRRRRQRNEERIIVDEPTDYVPASQVIPYDPPSRLPAKALEAERHTPGYRLGPSSPSSINTPELTNFGSTTSTGAHSRNPSDSHHVVADTTGQVATGPPGFVVHRDSGARLPQVIPQRLVDIPPAYTAD